MLLLERELGLALALGQATVQALALVPVLEPELGLERAPELDRSGAKESGPAAKLVAEQLGFVLALTCCYLSGEISSKKRYLCFYRMPGSKEHGRIFLPLAPKRRLGDLFVSADDDCPL